jgi:putative transcriptional regulator
MTMRKKHSDARAADLIRQGLEEAVAFVRGKKTGARIYRATITARNATVDPPPLLDSVQIIELRAKMGVSQTVFASALNVSPETVRAWEQGKKTPGGPALRLLEIVAKRPDVVLSNVAIAGALNSLSPARSFKRTPVARKR